MFDGSIELSSQQALLIKDGRVFVSVALPGFTVPDRFETDIHREDRTYSFTIIKTARIDRVFVRNDNDTLIGEYLINPIVEQGKAGFVGSPVCVLPGDMLNVTMRFFQADAEP